MMKNVCSPIEKTIRVIIGLAILGAGWYYMSFWGLIGIIPLLTVAFGWCPISALLGINSCEIKGRSS